MIGRVYKLVCSDGFFYFGSTVRTLGRRLTKHKEDAKIKPNRKIYKHIIAIGWDEVEIELLEEVVYICEKELQSVENRYIEEARGDQHCLNKNRAYTGIATGNRKEYSERYCKKYRDERQQYRKQYNLANKAKINQYYIVNKEKIKKRKKQYRIDNKAKIREHQKHYYIVNKEKIKKQDKQYYIDNKAKIREHRKQYRIDNRDKIRKWNDEKFTCECSGRYTRQHKARHFRTKLHTDYIKSKATEE